jgi:phosphoserine phosphatase
MRLHLIRHGQTDWNAIRRAQGHSDSRLTELGKQQAVSLGKELAVHKIKRVFCSSSLRTRQTAELVFAGGEVPVHHLDMLREIFLGPWEGHLYQDIEVSFPEAYHCFWKAPHQFALAGAETFTQLQQRGITAIEEICQQANDDDIAVVSHGAMIKSILCHFDGRPLAQLWEPPQMHNCSHSILELNKTAKGRVIKYI